MENIYLQVIILYTSGIRMENFRKIKQLNDKKAEKVYALSELQAKRSKIHKQSQQTHLINSQIEPQSANHQSAMFMIKNLDSNKIEVYHSIEKIQQKLLKGIDELPQIQKILQSIWQKYLTQLQKQQQQFLQACYQGDVRKVNQVVAGKNKHPIDPRTALTDQGKNGIHLATISGSYRNTQIIQVLVGYKVDIDGRTNQQLRTPLMVGSILGNQIAVKSLLKLGANMKLQDYQGNTALHHACIFNQQKIAQILIQAHFPLNIKNNKQKTPVQCVTNERIMKIMRQCGQGEESTQWEDQKKDKQGQYQQTQETQSSKCLQLSQLRQEKIKQIAIKEYKSINLSNFKKLSLLGRGAFGQVYLVENTLDQKRYAMKILDKGAIMRQNILRYAMTQRQILSTINHPFIVKLQFAFQTIQKLCLVMDYCPGGDLLNLIKKKGKLQQQELKKYVAQIILAIQALHRAQIIYRDLKPSNIIIDENGHACLTDFGLSKQASLSHSFCGSTAYLAPQMLWRRGHTKVLDWYLLGVLIYEGLTGRPPFWDSNKEQLLTNIKSGRYKHLGSQYTKEVRDLVQKLLRSNMNKRLGFNGSKEIKEHPWFSEINWTDVEAKKLKMTVLQEIKGKPIKQQVFEDIPQQQNTNKINGWDYIPKNI